MAKMTQSLRHVQGFESLPGSNTLEVETALMVKHRYSPLKHAIIAAGSEPSSLPFIRRKMIQLSLIQWRPCRWLTSRKNVLVLGWWYYRFGNGSSLSRPRLEN